MTEESMASRINRLTEAVREAGRGLFSGEFSGSGPGDELNLLGDAISQLVLSAREQTLNRRLAEDAGRLMEEQYRRLMTIIPGMVYQFALHPDGRFSFPFVNEACRQLFDVDPETLKADASLLVGLIHPDDRERFSASIKKSAETMQPWREVLRHIVHGEVRWYDCMSRPEPQPNGDILWDGIILEITGRKRAEESLKQSERKYRDIFESAPVGIFRSTLEGKFIDVNPAVARMLKYDTPEDMVRMVNRTSIAEAIYLDPSHRRELIGAVSSRGGWQVFEERFRCKDGSIIVCNFHYRAVPGQVGSPREFEGFVEDISERTLAEETLKLSQFIIENASTGIMRGRGDGRIMMANQSAARMLGYTAEELCSLSFFDIDPTLTAQLWRKHREKLSATGSNSFVTLHRRKDGTTFPVEVSVNSMEYQGQEISCSFTTDISKRKRAEDALRESEEKFRVLAETSPTAIALIQGERFVYVNQAAVRLTGYSEEELLDMHFWELTHADFREMVRNIGLARQRGEQVPKQYQTKIITREGDARWVAVSGSTMDFEGKPAGIVTFMDVTEAKLAEQRIQAALQEKEVLLKEIHHRVKNNLQIVSTLLDLQSESIHDVDALRSFRECQNRIAAMALVHEQLYQTRNFSSIDFHGYIEGLTKHLYRSYVMDPDRISLVVDAGNVLLGIDQAIPCGLMVNELVSNALKYAFPGDRHGTISIGFQSEEEGWICLTVADNGVGLPSGTDFFATETLGLQLVRMLVRQLKGDIRLDTNQGTSFHIRFQVSDSIESG